MVFVVWLVSDVTLTGLFGRLAGRTLPTPNPCPMPCDAMRLVLRSMKPRCANLPAPRNGADAGISLAPVFLLRKTASGGGATPICRSDWLLASAQGRPELR